MHRVAGWEVTNTGLTANKVEHLEAPRAELEQKLARFKGLSTQHAALTSEKLIRGRAARRPLPFSPPGRLPG